MAPMPTNSPVHKATTLLDELFRFFDREGIAFCALGNTVGYPETISGDVDLAVYPTDFFRMGNLLQTFCLETGVRLIQALQHEQTACAYIIAGLDNQGLPQFLTIDICSDYYRNGKLMLSTDELMDHRQSSENGKFLIPSPEMDFIYYLIKKIGKQNLNNTHGKHLSQIFVKDPENATRQINRFWSGQYADDLIEASRSNCWELIRQRLTDFQNNLHLPSQSQAGILRELRRKISRVLHPTGLFVVLLGPDGSGKSTVIQRIIETMSEGFRMTRIFHLRPHLGQKYGISNSPVTDPHGQSPRSLVFSMMKILYFWLDYTIGYSLQLHWLLVRSTLIVFDRYYYDFLVDPKRYRYQGSRRLLQWLEKLIPKPDLVILLDAPAEILQLRKQEVPLAETDRQRHAFLEVVQNLPNGYVVDASQPVENVVRESEQILLTYLEQRLKAHLEYH